MQVYTACRIEMNEDVQRRIEQHSCLVQSITKTTMVIRLHYSEWNPNCPPSTSIDGILVRCYFNKKFPNSNYIVAYGPTKAQSKRALLHFLNRHPLSSIETHSTTSSKELVNA